MIYVNVEAIKSEERGLAGGNCWVDTDDVLEAVRQGLEQFAHAWGYLGHGGIVTYKITVAPEASPNRTKGEQRWPLPVAPSERSEFDQR